MVLNIHRNHRAYLGRGEWVYGIGGRGRLYTYRYTVTTRMTPELRWAAMRAVLAFHHLCVTKSQDSVYTDYNL